MGVQLLLKSVGILDHIKQRNEKSLDGFYTRFNKELFGIDQSITSGQTICAFVRVFGPRGSAFHDSLSVISVNTVGQVLHRPRDS